ncbi:MAG: UDP-N-acetylglucosamine 1-carboxyvinyltransferase [Candidatus Moranbacteria bacterium]|nr:UDP-N-acetylglucosamine 1-carboxyvinyltransferase [Candidatus Moranbacteria bacterium]
MEKNNSKFIIRPSRKIAGAIEVKGAKNHALKVLAAAVLSDKEVIVTNVPKIEDIKRKIELLELIGVKVKQARDTLVLNAKNINTTALDPEKSSTIRTTTVLAGALLGRFGKVSFYHPGGCILGKRPIDIFLEGFQKLGAVLSYQNETITVTAKGKRLAGGEFFFPWISVTATEALILAAVLAKGKTVLKNCAQEPEIIALAKFLNACGAKIEGAGTSTVTIRGVKKIKGGKCTIMPDRIETATFIILGALHRARLRITKCNPLHIEALLTILKKAGAKFRISRNSIECLPYKKLLSAKVITHEYPGFATDIQPPYTVLATQAEGQSLIHDPIFEGRLFFTDSLVQMGANIIMCDPHRIVIQGPTKLSGKKLASPDIRAGIALVLAGSIAQGETTIDNIYQIDRGYEKIDERLRKVGVDIKRTS